MSKPDEQCPARWGRTWRTRCINDAGHAGLRHVDRTGYMWPEADPDPAP